MPIPATAVALPRVLDPSDIKDVLLDVSPALEGGEIIASYEIALWAEAIAAGMEIIEDGQRDPVLANGDTAIVIWPAIDAGEAEDERFLGDGVELPVTVTVVTNSNPSRTDQQTIVFPWAQK